MIDIENRLCTVRKKNLRLVLSVLCSLNVLRGGFLIQKLFSRPTTLTFVTQKMKKKTTSHVLGNFSDGFDKRYKFSAHFTPTKSP